MFSTLQANKLVELYKESSEEWSRKAGELEGVIKALEVKFSIFLKFGCLANLSSCLCFLSFCGYLKQTHLDQVEKDHNERLEKEVSARSQFEKVCFLTYM